MANTISDIFILIQCGLDFAVECARFIAISLPQFGFVILEKQAVQHIYTFTCTVELQWCTVEVEPRKQRVTLRAPTTATSPHHHHVMAGPPALHAGLASHQEFHPNLYPTTSASRVSSEPISKHDEKPSDRKHKSHRHHHGSRHDKEKEHRHTSSRRHAKEIVQSAIQLQPPTSFGDLLKQARSSKDTSPSHSRKGSVAPGANRNREDEANRDEGVTILPRKPLRPADVELERRRVEARQRYDALLHITAT
jgi:hypothetical protein